MHIHYPQKTDGRCNQRQQSGVEKDQRGDVEADAGWVVLVEYGNNSAGLSDYRSPSAPCTCSRWNGGLTQAEDLEDNPGLPGPAMAVEEKDRGGYYGRYIEDNLRNGDLGIICKHCAGGISLK
jgi:hypothetical protein